MRFVLLIGLILTTACTQQVVDPITPPIEQADIAEVWEVANWQLDLCTVTWFDGGTHYRVTRPATDIDSGVFFSIESVNLTATGWCPDGEQAYTWIEESLLTGQVLSWYAYGAQIRGRVVVKTETVTR